MKEATEEKKSIDWTTREELLLACAVERYGIRDWKTVAMEIQVRSSLPIILVSADACKSKFHDLKRRFMDEFEEDDDDDEKQDCVVISWLEKLRNLRVLELKEQVHQSDLSIQRLQLKVKRLEEDERDICLKVSSGDHDVNLDLTESPSPSPNASAAAIPDRNHRHSVNESNSSDYIDNSSAIIGHRDEKRVNSAELSNQTTELKIRKTVNKNRVLLDKDQRKLVTTAALSPATDDSKTEITSQPLVELLDVIRSHKQIRMLERRPLSQNKAVRQQMDLESIRSRIDDGSYSNNVNKFYRDLLLFFTNAIVSFPKTSSESAASYILRDLVLKYIKDNNIPSVPKPPLPPPPPAEAKKPVVVVCRRRSSILAKKENVEDKRKPASPDPITTKEKNKQVNNIISSVKSLRRGMNTQIEKSPEKKKRHVDDDRIIKKKGVVEFLKRIVSKSPPEKPKGRKKEEEEKKSGSKGGKNSPEERIVSGKRKRGRDGGGKEEAPLRIAKKPAKK